MNIGVLGTKRILILILLVAFNAALAAGVYMYLAPEKEKKDRELSSVKSKVSKVRQDIDRLQLEFEQLEVQQAEFEELQKAGFFSRQERNMAQRIFEEVQTNSGVISAKASVQAGDLRDNEESDKADYVMLVSPIKISIEALEDIDVFRYLYLLKKEFPGHISVERLNLERRAEITSTMFRTISSGSNPVLVRADIDLSWWTMIPKSDVIDR